MGGGGGVGGGGVGKHCSAISTDRLTDAFRMSERHSISFDTCAGKL